MRESLPQLRDPLSLGHQYLSQHVLLPALRMQQFLRPSRRPVALARRRALAFRSASADWSEQRKTEWILQQLRVTLRAAARTTAYYAELFASIGFDPNAEFSFNDFARLPVLDRSDIRSAGDRLLSSVLRSEQRTMMTTGGSTGAPLTVFLGPEEEGWSTAAIGSGRSLSREPSFFSHSQSWPSCLAVAACCARDYTSHTWVASDACSSSPAMSLQPLR